MDDHRFLANTTQNLRLQLVDGYFKYDLIQHVQNTTTSTPNKNY